MLTNLAILAIVPVVLVVCAMACAEGIPAGRAASRPGKDALAGLAKEHPRLILTERRLGELRKLAERDELLAKAIADVLGHADAAMKKPSLEHKLVGPRLLAVSRECLDRVYTLGLAWRWTGKDKYADKLLENLRIACAFDDWNPSHFLDTAEMAHAVAVGYDWLYERLGEADRATLREALISKAIEPGLVAYPRQRGLARFNRPHPKPRDWPKQWWAGSAFNWNQVCNGGLMVAALAIADSDKDLAAALVAAAVESLPRAMETYAPDGAWAEGPGYWSYATRYTVYALAALDTALGGDLGLSRSPGLDRTALFPLLTTGPTGLYLNFADVAERSARKNLPELFWLARRFDLPAAAAAEREMIARHAAKAEDVIWYVGSPAVRRSSGNALTGTLQTLPLAARFVGPVEVAVFRTAWGDPNALFAAIKAGYNTVNHGHLDLGTFELDALGERWVRDLGSDNYNLPGYWTKAEGGERWKYFRLNSQSHSVPLIGGRNQKVESAARITAFDADGNDGFAVLDLTEAYAPAARRASRGLRMLAGRAVLVQDELELPRSAEVAWQMLTDAKVTLRGREATLRIGRKTLTASLLSPEGAEWAVESAEQAPPQAANKGVCRLVARVKPPAGPVRFAVLLSPRWSATAAAPPPAIVPLAEWGK